jgi:hypothetical protein
LKVTVLSNDDQYLIVKIVLK